MELPRNHITLTSTQSMAELSSPLKILNISFFSYTRFYFDGTSISLVNNTDWYEFFLKQEVPGSVNVYKLKTGIHLWAELFPERAVQEAKYNFKIDNGIQFTYSQDDYMETFSFASTSNNSRSISTIVFNLDLLEKFVSYFRSRAEKLINSSLKQKILIQIMLTRMLKSMN